MDPAERSRLIKEIRHLLENEPEKIDAAARFSFRRAFALAEKHE